MKWVELSPFGAPAKSEISWGEEEGTQRSEAFGEAESGTGGVPSDVEAEQSGISSDDNGGCIAQPSSWLIPPQPCQG